MKKRLCLILSVLLLVSLLCGCGSSGSGTPSMAKSESAKAAVSGGTAYYAADNGAGWAMEAAAEAPEAPMPAPQTESKPTGSSLPENVKLIYRANIEMESTEFDKAVAGLNELVERLGGYYENSELNNYSSYRRGYYVIRVPAENFETFCSAVGGLAQVNNLSRSAEDVSERYYDLESRLATQQTKLARLQELLKQAEDMEDIITLESAISETELNIENLTGSLRKYDSLVGYSTITVSLNEVYKLTEVEEPVIGFGAKLGQAFRSGAAGFVNGMQRAALAVARGWVGWLVFIILVVAALLIVRKVRRKNKEKNAAAPIRPAAPAWQVPPQQPPQAPRTPPAPQDPEK